LADTATCEPTSCTSSSFGRNVFLATLGAEETQSFCPTISTAREQTISVAKRAKEPAAEYRRQKASASGG
jgi:hypothetical protein